MKISSSRHRPGASSFAGEPRAGAISQVVQQLALTRPEFLYTSNRWSSYLRKLGDGDLSRVSATVLGVSNIALLLAVVGDDGPSRTSVSGLLGHAMLHRPTRGGITFIVNGRWIQSRPLNFAVEEACRTWTPTGRFPIAVLKLDLPAAEVDVNVHPRKIEVRFQRERAMFTLVQRAVYEAVLAAQNDEAAHGMLHDEHDGRPLRVVGQAAQTYIIAEGEHGLYLVDQHAAHERVMLERILENGRQRAVQFLMEPAVVPVSADLVNRSTRPSSELGSLGYECEQFGNDALLVRHSGGALERQPLRVLGDTLEELSRRPRATDWRQLIAVRLACHSAVRAGDTLEPTGDASAGSAARRSGDLWRLRPRSAHGDPDEPRGPRATVWSAVSVVPVSGSNGQGKSLMTQTDYDFETLPGSSPRPGLQLVFVGINPSIYSVQRGHYFARSRVILAGIFAIEIESACTHGPWPGNARIRGRRALARFRHRLHRCGQDSQQ